ncbi:MAG TPA: hypothetical protein PLJ27_25295, partial [Polyangiaceae bacterium]|nr:hypothetical protein [Polyangiaceae bacterium]
GGGGGGSASDDRHEAKVRPRSKSTAERGGTGMAGDGSTRMGGAGLTKGATSVVLCPIVLAVADAVEDRLDFREVFELFIGLSFFQAFRPLPSKN